MTGNRKTNKLNDLDPRTWLKFQKSWFIHNPPRRIQGALVHPAKYPETLAQEFIEFFTHRGETVLDPMAGTGSTLVAALRAGRHSHGIELNPKYAGLARQIITEERAALGKSVENLVSNLINGDASRATHFDLPVCDYLLTSPPYWDMLHARGAATQKKRRAASDLDVFYSDDPDDLGNLHDYEEFLARLVAIYAGLKPLLREKAYLTIIVKNVKKGGKVYPLAWDLGRELGRVFTLKDEKLWCLPPGQKIWTQNGLESIEKVNEGDWVLTHLGSLHRVTGKMSRECSGQVIKIEPALMGTTISITPEHEIFSVRRRRYTQKNGKTFYESPMRSLNRGMAWLPAGELQPGDLVAFPILAAAIDLLELDVGKYLPEPLGGHQDGASSQTRGRGQQARGTLPKVIPVNEDFMRLAGWYLAQGRAGEAGVNITCIAPKAQNEISALFRSVFNATTKADQEAVWCGSTSIARLLIRLFGEHGHNKKIPNFILHLPVEKQKHLLQALWTAGGQERENRLTYKTRSEDLALGIVYLVTRFGAMPSIQRNAKYTGLYFSGQSIKIMHRLLNIKKPSAQSLRARYWLQDGLIWLPIRNIVKEDYKGPVYNLEVEGANTYVTECFTVHNCQDNQRLAPYGLGSAWVSNTFHHYCLQFRNESGLDSDLKDRRGRSNHGDAP